MKTENFAAGRDTGNFYDSRTFASNNCRHRDGYSQHKLINRQGRVIPSNADDLKIIHNLNRLDQLTMKFGDPERHEELLWDVQQGIMKRLDIWLALKGMNRNRWTIVTFSEVYLTFIYGIKHERPATLKNPSGQNLCAFMLDYLFRNDSVKAGERALCPSAIRLLYLFLDEKGYLSDSVRNMVELIDNIEPCFFHLLRETN